MISLLVLKAFSSSVDLLHNMANSFVNLLRIIMSIREYERENVRKKCFPMLIIVHSNDVRILLFSIMFYVVPYAQNKRIKELHFLRTNDFWLQMN